MREQSNPIEQRRGVFRSSETRTRSLDRDRLQKISGMFSVWNARNLTNLNLTKLAWIGSNLKTRASVQSFRMGLGIMLEKQVPDTRFANELLKHCRMRLTSGVERPQEQAFGISP
jgi:hypothetical protein